MIFDNVREMTALNPNSFPAQIVAALRIFFYLIDKVNWNYHYCRQATSLNLTHQIFGTYNFKITEMLHDFILESLRRYPIPPITQ